MASPSMNEIVVEMARYVRYSGFSVDWNPSMGWVSIQNNSDDAAFFLENEDADSFIAEANDKADEACVDLEIGMLAQAKPYIECID